MLSYYHSHSEVLKDRRANTDLTKKYALFKCTDEHQNAFDYTKGSLTSVPLSVCLDPNVPYTLYTDRSDTCIGSCHMQMCEGKEFFYLI